MAISLNRLLNDAKDLVNRLQEKDANTTNLISNAETLNKRLHAMKQYEEESVALNVISRHNKPRSALVLGLVHESRQIRHLQAENDELQHCIEEHQNVLQLVMSKYRSHVGQLVKDSQVDRQAVNERSIAHSKQLQAQIERMYEMQEVMRRAAESDDRHFNSWQEELEKLRMENKGLRQLLAINGTIGNSICRTPVCQERGVQTEIPDPPIPPPLLSSYQHHQLEQAECLDKAHQSRSSTSCSSISSHSPQSVILSLSPTLASDHSLLSVSPSEVGGGTGGGGGDSDLDQSCSDTDSVITVVDAVEIAATVVTASSNSNNALSS